MQPTGLSVAQFLKPYAEKRETGALEVTRGPYRGMLYIQGGVLVQAEYLGKVGLSAAYDILDMQDSRMLWRDKLTSSETGIALDLSQLLEELEQAKHLPPPPVSLLIPPQEEDDVDEEPIFKPLPIFSDEQIKSSDLLKRFFFSLEWLNSPEKNKPFDFEGCDQASYTVGSSEDCDFYLSQTGVEPLHFSLLVQDEHVEIWDLGTDNATFLNNELIDQAILSSGDIIRAGEASLRFSLHVRRSGQIAITVTEKKNPPVTNATSPRIRGPITAKSLTQEQSQTPALRKVFGRFFSKKGK